MLKLKLQYFDHLMGRTGSLEKILMLGKIEGRRRRGRQTMRWLDGIPIQGTWVRANSGRQWRTGKPDMLQSMELQRVRHDWATTMKRWGMLTSWTVVIISWIKSACIYIYIYTHNFLLKKFKGIESHSHFIIGSDMGAVERLRLCRERIQREGKCQGIRPGGWWVTEQNPWAWFL